MRYSDLAKTRFGMRTAVVLMMGWLAAGAAFAQQTNLSITRISSVPNGMNITVDKQTYITPVAFTWPAGSRHTIVATQQILGGADTVSGITYQFSSYTVTGGQVVLQSPGEILYTADTNLGTIVATYSLLYRVRVVFNDCSSQPLNPCEAVGTVIVGGTQLTSNGDVWLSAGVVPLQAFPAKDADCLAGKGCWIFTGWHNMNGTTAFLASVNITGPTILYPRFVRTRTVTVNSNPQGLKVLADRTTVVAPQPYFWGRTTTHYLSAVTDQLDNQGKLWVFDSWSDGGAAAHEYVVPEGESPLSVTANFIRGERVSFITSPPLLKLTVDGRSNWQGYNFNWGIGTIHSVTAPPDQRDARGRRWLFKGWSNGGGATQLVTVPEAGGLGLTLIMIATYEPESKIEIQSAMPGLSVKVDGASCALPCLVSREVGVPVQLAVEAMIPVSEASRLDFAGWSDSVALTRSLTTSMEPVLLTVSYTLRHKLTVIAEPSEGVTVQVTPSSEDGFLAADSDVQLAVETRPGYRFLHWDGDVAGAARSIELKMNGPKSVRAVLDRVPAITGGVRNAVGLTPVEGVAAGSVISIFGVNLAAELAAGPDAPLVQTLGDVTVRIKDRVLPLFFISPQQVNALIPSDLAEGAYRLLLRWEGKPDATADITIVGNAPGLFNRVVDDLAWAVAQHEDGSDITVDSPAKRGELVTLLATGAGRYAQSPPDGFALPDTQAFRLVDPVEIRSGDIVLTPEWAGLAKGRIGIAAIQFRIGDALTTGASEIRLRVNGADSNAVLLPVE